MSSRRQNAVLGKAHDAPNFESHTLRPQSWETSLDPEATARPQKPRTHRSVIDYYEIALSSPKTLIASYKFT